jgi:hypothetical protein
METTRPHPTPVSDPNKRVFLQLAEPPLHQFTLEGYCSTMSYTRDPKSAALRLSL